MSVAGLTFFGADIEVSSWSVPPVLPWTSPSSAWDMGFRWTTHVTHSLGYPWAIQLASTSVNALLHFCNSRASDNPSNVEPLWWMFASRKCVRIGFWSFDPSSGKAGYHQYLHVLSVQFHFVQCFLAVQANSRSRKATWRETVSVEHIPRLSIATRKCRFRRSSALMHHYPVRSADHIECEYFSQKAIVFRWLAHIFVQSEQPLHFGAFECTTTGFHSFVSGRGMRRRFVSKESKLTVLECCIHHFAESLTCTVFVRELSNRAICTTTK